MTVIPVAVSLAALLAVLAIAACISRVLRLPAATAQLLAGLAAATVVVSLGYDTNLRYWNFHDLVLNLLLPIVVFEAASRTDPAALRRSALPMGLLASVGLLASFLIVAAGLHYSVNHTAFTWTPALLGAAILCATDPTAITSHVQGHTNARVQTILEGESHFNDGISVVLYTTMMSFALAQTTPGIEAGFILFMREFIGGIAVGLITGMTLRSGTRWMPDQQARCWLVIALVLVVHTVANEVLGVSGVMVCLIAGLVFSFRRRTTADDGTWGFLGQTSAGALVALVGATITLGMFVDRWLVMIYAIAAVVGARLIVVPALLTASRTGPWRERLLIGAIGSRGAVTLALVLMLPTDLWYWYTLQSAAYGVVIFDLCIVAPLAPLLCRRLAPI